MPLSRLHCPPAGAGENSSSGPTQDVAVGHPRTAEPGGPAVAVQTDDLGVEPGTVLVPLVVLEQRLSLGYQGEVLQRSNLLIGQEFLPTDSTSISMVGFRTTSVASPSKRVTVTSG